MVWKEYELKSEIEAFGPNEKDVNGKTYAEELKEVEAAKKKEEEKKKAIIAARIAKRNKEMKKYEEQDDAMFNNILQKQMAEKKEHEKANMAEAAAQAPAVEGPPPPPPVEAPSPPAGPGANIDCDKATGNLLPGQDCGSIHMPPQSKEEAALANTGSGSQPIAGAAALEHPLLGVPGSSSP